MSEVAADNSRRTPEASTEADGKDPGEAMGRVLAEIHKGTTGDDSPYRGAASAAAVRQGEAPYGRVLNLWRAGTSHGTPLLQMVWSEV
jgi:hypothetical protein